MQRVYLFLGSFAIYMSTIAVVPQSKSINVKLAPEVKPLYAAMYYVQSHSAQRIGSVKKIDTELLFDLPAGRGNVRRYLMVSEEPERLIEVVRRPFYAEGVVLIALPTQLERNPVLTLNAENVQALLHA